MNLQRDRSAWLHGPQSACQEPAVRSPRCRRIVLLGPPGVGKGTQAALLSAAFGACHLSTGDVFRAARHGDALARTPALSEALACMDRGELISDDLVLQLVRERMSCLACSSGFLLDGFPRTVAQARALDELLRGAGLGIDRVVSFELPLDEIVSRIGGRRTCPVCKHVYHLTAKPPRNAGYCDACGSALEIRPDDRPEAVSVRQTAYQRNTSALFDYYSQQQLLRHVDASGTPEDVFSRTVTALD